MASKSAKWSAGLACVWIAWVAQAAPPEHWAEARSAHFVVLSDGGEKETARLAGHFERMRQVFAALLPAADEGDGQLVTVVAVKDRQEMQRLEPAAYLLPGQIDLAGFFLHSVDKDYILVRADAEQAHAYSVVYHEYTHSLLRKTAGWMPLWLNEGLAEYYENTDFQGKDVWLGETDPEELNLLKRNPVLPLTTLLTVDAGSPYYHDEAKGSIFYAESWALTHMLTVSDRLNKTDRIRDYTERLALGEDSVTAATGAFGDLNKLQTQVEEYVAQRKFMYFMMTEAPDVSKQQVTVRPMAEADADAVRADVMAHTGRTNEAVALLNHVLTVDATNGPANEAMGYLRYRTGDFAGAEDWFAKALAIDAKSYRAQAYLALAMMRGSDKDDDVAIEAHLREALQLNPQFAPADNALAMFEARRQRDPDETETLARRAVELEPGELSFRVDCAEVMTANREFAEALRMLQQAMPLARTVDQAKAVHDRMDRVARSQTALAGVARRASAARGYGQ